MNLKTLSLTFIKILSGFAAIAAVGGTTLWLAIDIASFYTENQFTGKMKAYDAHWINCVGAVFVITLGTAVCKAIAALTTEDISDS